jgi:hypothetical protein
VHLPRFEFLPSPQKAWKDIDRHKNLQADSIFTHTAQDDDDAVWASLFSVNNGTDLKMD